MKRCWLSIVAATSLLTLCTSASAADRLRIGLPTTGASEYAAPEAAERLGYFKEAGLEVEVTSYRSGGAALDALSAGAADMVSSVPAQLALRLKKGAKEIIVSTIDARPVGWHILVRPDSRFRSIADLKDATMGIPAKGGASDMYGS